MKKTILAVVAIVLTLGVSTAFARTQILPLAVQEPVDFVTEQMWNAINLLQDQVNQFGSQTVQNTQRINELEQVPTVKTLKVFDANNQFVGELIRTDTLLGFPTLVVYVSNLNQILSFNSQDGSLKRGGDTTVWYEAVDCQGQAFLTTYEWWSQIPYFVNYGPSNPAYYTRVKSVGVRHNIIPHSKLQYGVCDSFPGSTFAYPEVVDVVPDDISFNFQGPLQIKSE